MLLGWTRRAGPPQALTGKPSIFPSDQLQRPLFRTRAPHALLSSCMAKPALVPLPWVWENMVTGFTPGGPRTAPSGESDKEGQVVTKWGCVAGPGHAAATGDSGFGPPLSPLLTSLCTRSGQIYSSLGPACPCALHASCCPSHLAGPAFAATPGTLQCVCLCLAHWPFASPWTLGPSSGAPHALCWPRLQGDSVLFPASLHPAALPGGGSISKPQGAGGSSARAGLVQRWRGRSHVRILGAAN